MFLLFYKNCEETPIVKYLFPYFEDVFKYLSVLMGAESDVILIAVEDDFVRIS